MFGISVNFHPRKIGDECKKSKDYKKIFIESVDSYIMLYPFLGRIFLKNGCKTLELPLAVW